MQEVLKAVLENLKYVSFGIVLFIIAYGSNMAFSLYYNTKILKQPFDKEKLIDSGLKIVAFGVGTALLCVSVTTIPIFTKFVGLTIPKEYTEVFQNLAILTVFLISACKYVLEAYDKFKKVLDFKTSKKEESK